MHKPPFNPASDEIAESEARREERVKLLFVCSRNKWRSPTAERVFSKSANIEARSRGLSASAVRRLTAEDVAWSDVIFVMESKHKKQLYLQFRVEVGDRAVHVLDIPDEYRFMDPELVELIRTGVTAVLANAEVR